MEIWIQFFTLLVSIVGCFGYMIMKIDASNNKIDAAICEMRKETSEIRKETSEIRKENSEFLKTWAKELYDLKLDVVKSKLERGE